MKFYNLLWKNIKKSQKDYTIFSISLIFLCGLLFASNVISFIEYKTEAGVMSNSLPLLIAITIICFLMFINKFMISQRSREFATYMLSGLSKKDIIVLYGMESFAIEIVGLVIGSICGYIFTYIVSLITNDTLLRIQDPAQIIRIFLTTTFQVMIICLFNIVYSIFVINRLNLRKLMYHKTENEKEYKRYKWLNIALVVLVGVFAIQLLTINRVATSGTIFIVLVMLIYVGYLCLVNKYNIKRKGKSVYDKAFQLYRAGILLSKQRSFVRLSSVLSGVFILSAVCYNIGGVFVNSQSVLLDKELDHLMGITQIYFSILFLVVLVALTGIRQMTEITNNNKSLIVLRNIGVSKAEMKKNLLIVTIQNYILPIVVGVLILVMGFLILFISNAILPWIKVEMLKSTLQFIVILIVVLACFILGTYRSYINHMESIMVL
ncbi:hypothetical protein M2454_000642 [Aequitasia blattaphilus]|uniref:ABC3 transporter permease C-terminal domain-containing protein n=1 Tax=Aequitasia blattaphilus TaxID=2949332 RepID=A0ABT1E8M5_9FIRM|nr:FtsX-like permease family protein [Aequitasia blattaphilus]MCP1102138.1 hypothetical protein [Aequitasia blattaphilus]MCR8614778.1 hypothetical protein [Aequitasia blattaphilus]